ncbi:cellulose synthase/poly-beta-1,6-N-acetylglucosamine synthase-like glycosyltransferase [Christiangramia gaetbulicola]|uniref:Cellulose synthase/poly-beta-1,6-N-acetylglucosamine synthase-like glycosyltransferase n=1 Tax=Christiangramia gaetbulicola TaxID=703340 RepID=A0A2T6ADX1_9FLAO|nr:glycosyltransferase [Christiangramia gaetbulicola]PTX42010.1 cellulose synthase/poly-beta-1,6-N-acetylglucosamine synthase-like glycosyltransferase [Christiangramia gaetbulicola]
MRNKIKAPTKNEDRIIKFLILLGIVSILNFIFFFLNEEYWGNLFLFGLLLISLFYGILKKLYLWYNYSNISIPKIPEKKKEFTVDVLTTYFPGEPRQMIITTLEAILKIKYPHETYLCDEANDLYLKKFCLENGIHHVTRNNRKDAKAGNINNALEKVATGEIAVILDPDHIPDPDFLDTVLPYFTDPKIAFVQTVQGYYNIKETLVARGAAEQTFQFYGPMMMTLNSYKSVNAIGANCVFRRSALDSIGGHAPGLCEDMHTAMQLYAKGWQAVYLPEVLAQGLAPSNLTSYFKQQLKWARGTFELLFKVYPKLYIDFSLRQKVHFGILPLHYLSGVIYLINFLIPIISLLFSVTPWKGNVIDFALVLLPVVISSILIRTFIQKWVINKKERGFHLIGGLLEINTWWIYILGLFYTIIDKNIPYLPTPKENEFATNLKIIIPNSIVAFLSLFAVYIGLMRDFTPFTLVMAGFAIFNAIIMLLGVYLTIKTTNENNILKNNLNQEILTDLNIFRSKLFKTGNSIFSITRFAALPLLLFILVGSLHFKQKNDLAKWDKISPQYHEIKKDSYLGIYHPEKDTGLVNLNQINQIEEKQNVDFDIISFYLGWDIGQNELIPGQLMDSIARKGAIPMITWEPWLPVISDSARVAEKRSIFQRISSGDYDTYIANFGRALAEFDKPVFLRFAHEFDNPQYPWSQTNAKHPEEFKLAWKHIYKILKAQGAKKTMFVWNPWKAKGMGKFYPGDEYVDWVGFTILNYGPLNMNGKSVAFEKLYQRFHDKLYWFTRKPVMLAEFGSIKHNGNQSQWLKNAARELKNNYNEIAAVVMFNSAFDDNIPVGKIYPKKYLDWTTDSISYLKSFADSKRTAFESKKDRIVVFDEQLKFNEKPKGVRYKKGLNWKDNYYVLSRETLLEDFKLMNEHGINTIHYPGGNVYERNTLKYALDQNVNIIYDFRELTPKYFLEDRSKLGYFENSILEKIEELKTLPNITGLSFNLPSGSNFIKPLLFEEREASIEWYSSVFSRIKARNISIPLILDLELNADTRSIMKDIVKTVPIDYFGLIVKDTVFLKETIHFANQNKIPLIISSISADIGLNMKIDDTPLIVENWQDERLSNKLSFDGLLDFEGRKKLNFKNLSNHWSNKKIKTNQTKIGILKPAISLIPSEKVSYQAMLFSNGKWFYGNKIEEDYLYEWTLIKTDTFNNPLALKKLGNKPELSLKIPHDYDFYRLLLTVKSPSEDFVMRSITKLNTPLITEK